MENKKIVTICLLVVGVFLYWVASQAADLVFSEFNWLAETPYGVTYPQAIGVGISVLVVLISLKNKKLTVFLGEVAAEMQRVTYPELNASGKMALGVLAMIGVATLVLALFDGLWTVVTRMILNVSA